MIEYFLKLKCFSLSLGQIELYTHIPVMKKLVEKLQSWDFRVCVVFLLDAQFLVDAAKFVSGSLCALSTMINLEVPHVNILTKMDLLSKKSKKNLNRRVHFIFIACFTIFYII